MPNLRRPPVQVAELEGQVDKSPQFNMAGPSVRLAFTLLEVVLAIGLCGAVMVLLTTAIDLYLVRVDTSRTEVEMAQLARAILQEIATDLRATRFSSASAPGGSSSATAGNGSSSLLSSTALLDRGIYGNTTELRIDRASRRSWRQVTLPTSEVLLETDPRDMPQTIEYFFVDGRIMPSAQLAAGGLAVMTSLEGYAGLFRRMSPAGTATVSPLGSMSQATEPAELLAPEIVDVRFMYSDGVQWYEQWDSSVQQGLPAAIEVTVSLFNDVLSRDSSSEELDEETRRRDSTRWVEYRLVVRIPMLDDPQQLGGLASTGGSPATAGGLDEI